MPNKSRIKSLITHVSWSFSGTVLAIVFGALSVYLGFFKKENPDIDFIITSNSNVLDVRENLSRLDILYDGESLAEKGNDLKIITLKIQNNGNSSVLIGSYDPKNPLGYKVIDGTIADEPTVVEASSEYLKTNIELIKKSGNAIELSKIIIEPGDFITIKNLILYSTGKTPEIASSGKIAGVKSIDILNEAEAKTVNTDSNIMSSGLITNIKRTAAFSGIGIISLLVALGLLAKIAEIADRLKRKKLIKQFKNYHKGVLKPETDQIFETYRKSPDHFQSVYLLKIEQDKKPTQNIEENEATPEKDVNDLEAIGLIKFDNGKITTNDYLWKTYEDFYKFLKRNGEFKDIEFNAAGISFKSINEKNKLDQN